MSCFLLGEQKYIYEQNRHYKIAGAIFYSVDVGVWSGVLVIAAPWSLSIYWNIFGVRTIVILTVILVLLFICTSAAGLISNTVSLLKRSSGAAVDVTVRAIVFSLLAWYYFFHPRSLIPCLGAGETKFVVIQLILFVVILMLLSGTVIYNLILGTDYTVLAPIAFFLAMALSKVPLFSCTIGSLVSEVRISLLKKSGSEYSTLHHNLDELPPPPSTTASELPVPPGTDSSVNK